MVVAVSDGDGESDGGPGVLDAILKNLVGCSVDRRAGRDAIKQIRTDTIEIGKNLGDLIEVAFPIVESWIVDNSVVCCSDPSLLFLQNIGWCRDFYRIELRRPFGDELCCFFGEARFRYAKHDIPLLSVEMSKNCLLESRNNPTY